MTYLYAGLGIAMLTAVMAMFQIAMGLTQQRIVSKPPQDTYVKPDWKFNDRQFLRLINAMNAGSVPASTCDKIKDVIDKDKQKLPDDQEFSDLYAYDDQGLVISSSHFRLTGACALALPNGNHRVLIAPAPAGAKGYRLFSCLITDSYGQCGFEKITVTQ